MVNTNAYLMLLAGAAMTSILVAAAMPSGPTMMPSRGLEMPTGQVLIQAPGQATLFQRR